MRCNSEIEPAKWLAWVLRTPCATAGADTVEQLNVECCKGHNQSLAEFCFRSISDTVAKECSRISPAYESWLWQQTTIDKLWPSEKKWIETSGDNKAVWQQCLF